MIKWLIRRRFPSWLTILIYVYNFLKFLHRQKKTQLTQVKVEVEVVLIVDNEKNVRDGWIQEKSMNFLVIVLLVLNRGDISIHLCFISKSEATYWAGTFGFADSILLKKKKTVITYWIIYWADAFFADW